MNIVIDSSLTPLSSKNIERIKAKAKEYCEKIYSLDQLLLNAERLGIIVSFQQFFEVRAMLVNIKDYLFIGVNCQLSEAEQVKSILHEIGHLVLHAYNQQLLRFICVDDYINYRDMEADFFAFICCDEWIRKSCQWSFLRKGTEVGSLI